MGNASVDNAKMAFWVSGTLKNDRLPQPAGLATRPGRPGKPSGDDPYGTTLLLNDQAAGQALRALPYFQHIGAGGDTPQRQGNAQW